jgi:hypothetical protein
VRDDSFLQQRTLPDLGALEVRNRLSEMPMADIFYSFGRSHPGAITLHNYPKFLQHFNRPDGELIDLASIDVLRTRERGVPRYNEFRRLFHLNPVSSFEELTDNPAWVEELRQMYGDVERVDLMIGLYAEPKPEGFGFSDTAFRVFILMASRRLESDRFFTRDYRPEVYTPAGFDWVENNTMRDVLLRHFPQLAPALEGVANPFAPWTQVTAPPPPRPGEAQDIARTALGAIRIVNGALALLAPRWLARRLGAKPGAERSVVYALRLFGIRTVLIGADLWRRDDQAREHAVNVALVVHASDVCAAVVAGVKHQLPRRSAFTAAAISTVNVVLALVARPRGGRR